VYLHRGRAYISTAFKTDSNLVYVKPVPRLSYYTEVCEHSSIHIDGIVSTQSIEFLQIEKDIEVIALRRGCVTVTRSVYAYNRVDKKSGSIIDKVEVSQPAYEYKTMAVWSEIPISIQQGYLESKTPVDKSKKKKVCSDQSLSSKDEYDRGALHAIEHVMCSLLPALLMCDSTDLSCQHTRRTGDVNRYYLLIFESSKLGLGLTEKIQDKWFELLRMSYDIVRKCPCSNGCPSVSLFLDLSFILYVFDNSEDILL
jgi:DEAD/DEAH box helicase domain-containing protein